MESAGQVVARKATILLVDDERDVRAAARDLLSRWGYNILEAGDGLAAIELAGRARPDLVLLDVRMPGLSGLDVLPLLRSQPGLELTPVIVVTGNYSAESHAEAIRMGADDYLSKPFHSTLLRARVQSTLEKVWFRRDLEETRRNFSAMIVHDISNPLMIVQGFAQLLMDEPCASESSFVSSSLTKILNATNRALVLVSQTLDLSKLEAGGLKLEKRRQSLRTLLQEISEDQQVLARHKQIELTTELSGQLDGDFDALKLTEVIVNVVSNAIKFTPERGRVCFSACDSSAGGLRISIQDSGPGIPPDQLDMVFAPWKQASGRPMNVKGYGLGLAISRLIVEAHGGQIKVESTLGVGTTFHITLPAAGAGNVAPARGQPSSDIAASLAD
ncbi:MAG: hybrid sensor histidine kinase/response regulator [Candidatus Wallbacteria bacterium]|nr:hybrid sensor histidine kinase/response regulator [Candidatus Wallbacteria bacterium]